MSEELKSLIEQIAYSLEKASKHFENGDRWSTSVYLKDAEKFTERALALTPPLNNRYRDMIHKITCFFISSSPEVK